MPRNPLAEYIDRPTPYFDYTDAHTWYDGLWGGGQWPPEGIRGIGQFTPGFPPGFDPPVYFHTPVFFPGDRSRIAAGMRGLGQTCSPLPCCDSVGNCYDAGGNMTQDQYGNVYGSAGPAGSSNIPCFTGPVGALQPGQVYCATGTRQSPYPANVSNPPTSTQQPQPQPTGMTTQTMVMIGMAAGMALLFILAVRR